MIRSETVKAKLKELLSLDAHPGHIAAGFAVGVFVSFTPFFGIHTPMAIALAFLFRLNKVSCITGAWVNTPFTVVPVLVASHRLGAFLLGDSDRPFHFRNLEWASLKTHAESILLGSSIIGFFIALLSYFVCYRIIIAFRSRDASQAEMTREMEEVGEELK